MRFGVVVFPGSNCDEDIVYVLSSILKQETIKLWHKDKDLQGCDALILPGGFSYGDYLRSGAIARFSPIMEKVSEHAAKGGFIFGVCNGFQILCEAGLLPGALLHNNNLKFVCKNVLIKTENTNNIITQAIPKNKLLKIPIAHAEGRYFTDERTLSRLNENQQILFRYCNEEGIATEERNPNGSLE